MKWVGIHVSYTCVKRMQKTRGFFRHKGIDDNNLSLLLRRSLKKKCYIRYTVSPQFTEIRKHLQQGGIVILASDYDAYYKRNDMEGHYFLLTDVSPSGKTYATVNLKRDKTTMRIRKNTLKGHLRRSMNFPAAWFLRKIDVTTKR